MTFGESIRAAPSADPATWLAEAVDGRPGTVGALVPNRYASLLRLLPPEPAGDEWWHRYRELFVTVAEVGAEHTSTPGLAWFAVWEGHGFQAGATRIGWRDPPADEAERQWRAEQRARQEIFDRERNAAITAALNGVPQFDLPHRRHYLVSGPLSATRDLRYPDGPDWRNPDLFWPDDRSWFAATDVDIWSLYVGGTAAFTDELMRRTPTPCEIVGTDDPLPNED